jgi:hypothetical protein
MRVRQNEPANCRNRLKGRFGIDGVKGSFGIDRFKDSFRIDGFKDGGFKDGALRDGGFKDGALRDGGFKDRFAIAWFTPILFLLIEFVPFSADVRRARPATIRVVQVGTSALIAF